MQYLDSIIIHNFKSFKHANIKFSKGFNCIVGPNGSGKSNICDSLLFALGESSLKRMRVPNTTQLINSFAKPKNDEGLKRAYVKINLAGNNPTEVARIIKSNNKISYRLNGNRATRQEVIDVLRGYRSEINDTNIIAQGEISYMVNLTPKERRELIDVAAGIKEFNDKKESSMKELEKVEEKINSAHIILNERKGFLDQLEKEKEDAEKYLKLMDTVKRINYTLLKNNEKQSESDFNSTIEKIKTNEQNKKDATEIIAELDLMLEKYSKEKETLSKGLNERSVELSSTNKILENINKEIAVKETQSRSLKEKLSESESQIDQSSKEKEKIKYESENLSKKISSSRQELNEKSKHLESKEINEFDSGKSQITKISGNQKRIDELYSQEESMSKQYLQSKFEIEALQQSIKSVVKEIASISKSHEENANGIKLQKDSTTKLEGHISEISAQMEKKSISMQQKRKQLDELYVESVNLKESIAISGGGTDKLNGILKKSITKGFYGRAYELCTYDQKYEMAINSAATNRLNYFVVETAEIADDAIKLIKASNLGRASFIPIKDMVSKYKEENASLNKLLEHITYDKKFEKAFNYIFANTYVVESIEAAKRIGFGKGRFVTLEGELIEQSGVIIGGSKKSLQIPSILESKLKNVEKQRNSINEEVEFLNSEMDMERKEIAKYQTESLNFNIEIKHLQKSIESLKSELEAKRQKENEYNQRLSQLEKNSEEIDKKRSILLDELSALKTENEKIYSLSSDDQSKAKSKIGKTEMEKLKSLRSEAEELKIGIATLSKELELKNARIAEIENEMKARSSENKETMKKLALLDNEIIEFQKKRTELQEKIGKSDAHSQELYKKIQQYDSYISKTANDKGKSQSELEKTGRELIEQETRKVQIQTRINDIKAELLSYQNVEILKNDAAGELEAKRTIAKNDIERLGPVNLKAPEVYESKKKDVDEAASKLNVLGNEKDSIIAMINEIESKKLNIFNETLNDVNTNFEKMYGYVFEGSAKLHLENSKDPFNSGLSIIINSPKNKNSSVDSLSGGEKILVMLMVVFAIQTHNPMSFYIFDEIDISLDKENSKKLSKLMKEISKKSQVIVISHNDSLITAADTAIGVVNRNHESKVVGLQLTPTEIKAN